MSITDKQLMQLCINSYAGKHGTVKPVFTVPVAHIERYEVDVTIGAYDNQVIVVFRGSSGNDDWFDNFRTSKKMYLYGDGEVHEGFNHQYRLIRPELLKMIDYKDTSIIFTGHSLGGALATLAAADFNALGANVSCITFGSPRVGDNDFVKFFNLIAYKKRYIYGADTVCKVPPVWLGFRHVDKEIKLNQHLSWREKLLYPIRWFAGNPKDHEPVRYFKAMKG